MRSHFLAWPFIGMRVQSEGRVVEGKREERVKSLMFLLLKTLIPLGQGATFITPFTLITSFLVLSQNSHMAVGLGLWLWIWRGHNSVHSRAKRSNVKLCYICSSYLIRVVSGSQYVVQQPAAATSPGSLIEMKILRTYPQPPYWIRTSILISNLSLGVNCEL